MGFLDEEGFLTIVDRAKDFLKCGGTRVSCKEIEEALLRFPEIVEAAVAPMPDELLGEAVAAFVVPRDPGDKDLAARLSAFAAKALPPHLQPRRLWTLPALPKSDAGKVQRAELRRIIASS
jgi:acyl-coenzyme A synthetase/AMP-(fatty) acid ligase